MENTNTFELAGRQFKLGEPSFSQLSEVKETLGFDIVGGNPDEKAKKIFEDFQTPPKVIAILVTEVSGGTGGAPIQKDVANLSKFFYENGTISLFKKVLDFFTQSLKGTSGSISAAALAAAESFSKTEKK